MKPTIGHSQTQEITLSEMSLFLDLVKTKSIRELSRRRNELASQVSKALKRLETKVGSRLAERSVHGLRLTTEGNRLVPIFRQTLKASAAIEKDVRIEKQPSVIAIGSTSFLIHHLLAQTLSGIDITAEKTNFRFLEIAPDQMTVAGLRNAFEVAIYFGDIEWPRTWHKIKLGDIKWNFCCRSQHALTKKSRLSTRDILEYPFVLPSYWTQEGFVEGDDGCPIPRAKRKKGDETSTAEAALILVRHTNQISFLPDLLFKDINQKGDITILKPKQLETIQRPLYMSVRSDLVSDKIFQKMRQAVQAKISF